MFNGSYGSFYDTGTVTNAANTGQPRVMQLNTSDTAATNGIAVTGPSNSRVTVSRTGVYNLDFSAQFLIAPKELALGPIEIWLSKNGITMPWTASRVYIDSKGGHAIAAWNFYIALAAGDYVELVWACLDPQVSLASVPATGSMPAIPSLIVTMDQVS